MVRAEFEILMGKRMRWLKGTKKPSWFKPTGIQGVKKYIAEGRNTPTFTFHFYCSKENYWDWAHNMSGHTHNSLKVCIFDQTAHWSGIHCGRSRARTRVIAKAISPSNTVRSNGLSHVGAGHSLTTVQTLWWKGLALLQVSAWRKLWENPQQGLYKMFSPSSESRILPIRHIM